MAFQIIKKKPVMLTWKSIFFVYLSLSVFSPFVAASNKEQFTSDNAESFIILPKAKILQKYGIDNFCRDTSTYGCPLISHRKYAGMRGYFISMEPVKQIDDFEFRPVVLENGEKFFFVSSRSLGVYGAGRIENLAATKKLRQQVGSKVAPNSAITIASMEGSSYGYSYKLSNGAVLSTDQYQFAARLSSRMSDDSKRDEFFRAVAAGFVINHDKIEDIYFINPGLDFESPLRVYVGIKGANAWLRMKIFYTNSDWIFATSYLIVAGERRYESPSAPFQRGHNGGTVWEWRDESPNAAQISVLRAVSSASEVTMRFKGKYNFDRSLTAKERTSVASALRIQELLTR
jgi:hypothetical protein